jgi:type IX secretion system substrate protein
LLASAPQKTILTLTPLFNENWTGVESVKDNIALNIWPNPANDIFSIKMEKRIDEIEIYDVFGHQVYHEFLSAIFSFDISSLNFKSGIYFLRLKAKNNYYPATISIIH